MILAENLFQSVKSEKTHYYLGAVVNFSILVHYIILLWMQWLFNINLNFLNNSENALPWKFIENIEEYLKQAAK